jgi:hypothetical protein
MFKQRGTVGDKNLLLPLWCENKKRRKVSVGKKRKVDNILPKKKEKTFSTTQIRSDP